MPQLLLGLAFLVLTGCATRIDWTNPQAITAAIRVDKDPFKKLTSFEGPNCAADRADDAVLLRAFKVDTGAMTFQIYIADSYTHPTMRGGGWRLYSLGFDADGSSLPLRSINRTVDWCGRYVCSYREIVGLTITRDYLEQRHARGITVKISGTGGDEIFSIPATYVQAFLSITQEAATP